MALIEKLSAIGDAIREKGGTTELLTLDEMPVAIAALEVGGGGSGGDGVPESIVLDGTNYNGLRFVFQYNNFDWLIRDYGDRITTTKLNPGAEFFRGTTTLDDMPITLNFDNTSGSCSLNQMFLDSGFKTISGVINCNTPYSVQEMFSGATRLRYLPTMNILSWTTLNNQAYTMNGQMFRKCNSLREINSDLLKHLWSNATTSSYSFYNMMFNGCWSLDEIRGLGVSQATLTSNHFGDTFANCGRVKDIIFDTNADGTPYIVNWRNQTIDLTNGVGYLTMTTNSFINYNHGITLDDCIYQDTYGVTKGSYSALKDNPNYTSFLKQYSRYNHDSAVNTINSLPDASEYIISNGGSNNTIKFKTGSGEYTDGGAISTLTAEEIAVATAKGWTVTMTT